MVVGQTATTDVPHHLFKAECVIHLLSAVVEAKDLLTEVSIQMKRFHRNVSTLQRPLEKRPEVLYALRVNLSAYILLHVVHGLVDEKVGCVEVVVADVLIGVDVRTPTNVLQNLVLQGLALRVGNNHRSDFAGVARPHPHHDSFLVAVLVSDAAFLVHVAGLATDVRLVNLYGVFGVAAQLLKGLVLHRLTDTVKHEPCRLLCDADGAGKLVAGNPILAIGQHPDGHHPLVQSESRILEDGSHFQTELLLASVALPYAAGLDEGVLFGAATGTGDLPVPKPKVKGVLESAGRIGEEDDCFLKCMRGLHIENVPLFFTCVKYVISLISIRFPNYPQIVSLSVIRESRES